MKSKILVTGCPGSGKSTLVLKLKENGVTAVDMDNFGYHSKIKDKLNWIVPKRSIEAVIEIANTDIICAGMCNNLLHKQPYITHDLSIKQADPLIDIEWTKKYWLTYDEADIIKRVSARDNRFGRKQAERDEIKRCLTMITTMPELADFIIINTSTQDAFKIVTGAEEPEPTTEASVSPKDNTIPDERTTTKDEPTAAK